MSPDEFINSLLIREIVNVTRDGIVIERVRVGGVSLNDCRGNGERS